MSGFGLKSTSTGGTIQVSGTDVVIVDSTGINAGISTALANYFNPINNTGATSDLSLGVLQSTYITASGATSIPLHVACGNGQIYEMEMAGTYTLAAAGTNAYLQINNAVPTTNSFAIDYVYQANATVVGSTYAALASNGHLLGIGGGSVTMLTATLWTSTANKKAIVESDCPISGTTYSTNLRSTHNDTTTVWSSLGTVIQPNAWTGTVLVRRIA